ncbi:AvrE-family type 3 secretion system effector [Ralstonia syzygii]|uniref:AvrE-family type 3 secretion system effector n=1 Tax=Ralstonia syzygii TaxID=28097 RepID=UPI001E398283|nr:AvrE-family type 3 secretion system effector [Ralstonia syzygii]
MKIKKYLPVCFTGRAAKDTTLSSTQPESQKKGGKRSTGMLAGLISRSRKSSGPDTAARQKPLAEPGSDVRAAGPRERHNSTLQQLFNAEPNHASTAGTTQVPPFADERTWATASAPDIREIRPASPGSAIKLEGPVSGTPVKAAAAGGGGAPLRQEPLFDLTLKKGKIRVKARHPRQDSEQARQLGRLLTLRDNRATGLAWNPATGGYLIDYQKHGVRYWVGTHGKSLPAIVLPVHPAMKQGVCPPPIGLLANLSGSPDGVLWREHHGQLYQWDMQQAQWKPHPLPGKGQAPITLLGRQLDGEAWARAGSMLLKLGAGGVQVREVAGLERFPVVRMDTAGRPLALDGQGQLWRPDLRKAAPRPIRLQLADGRPAFEPVQLGKPDQPVTRARARDFALAPDGRTVFVRDQQGHLYQGDLHAADTSSGEIKARRVGLPVRVPGSTEGWGVEALATSPGRSGEGAALHAVFRSSEGQRVSAAWDGQQWQPQWHVEQPLLLVSERGLQGPAMRTVCTYNDGAMLGISAAGEACQKDGAGQWRPLLQADGTPLANLQDLKLGPLGLADAKPVYALQAAPDGGSRLLALEFGGNMARLPARPGVAVAAVPAQRYVSQVGVLAASSAPIRDFAVDGEGVAYHLTDDHALVRTPPGGQPQRLPAPPPGLIQIDQIAVSSDKHQVFALARGSLREGDAAPQLCLLRYDHASATWADCRADLSVVDPETVRLGISRLGTLQLTTGPACGEGERRIHRVVPPLGAQQTYRLLATGAAEPTVSQALTGHDAQARADSRHRRGRHPSPDGRRCHRAGAEQLPDRRRARRAGPGDAEGRGEPGRGAPARPRRHGRGAPRHEDDPPGAGAVAAPQGLAAAAHRRSRPGRCAGGAGGGGASLRGIARRCHRQDARRVAADRRGSRRARSRSDAECRSRAAQKAQAGCGQARLEGSAAQDAQLACRVRLSGRGAGRSLVRGCCHGACAGVRPGSRGRHAPRRRTDAHAQRARRQAAGPRSDRPPRYPRPVFHPHGGDRPPSADAGARHAAGDPAADHRRGWRGQRGRGAATERGH